MRQHDDWDPLQDAKALHSLKVLCFVIFKIKILIGILHVNTVIECAT
jgi:hypothetical protein